MIEQLIEAGREIVAAGMVKGYGGNLSGRFEGQVAITRSGADLGQLTAAEFVLVPLDGEMVELRSRQPRPSSEVAMHLSAYAVRPETQAIIHVHPPKAIGLGILGYSLPALTPDGYLHLGAEVPLLPYITPTTDELGTAVAELLRTKAAVLLQNHGVIVIGSSVSQALLRLSLLEEAAGIYLDALAVGNPRVLSAQDRESLDTITGGKYKMTA
ncbi:MAG: class II aldolase/adducin family protein [Ardenticatenaceae bacterium]|nr:class II aldolase/adducin family protein [Ardenticatenaceae bacterium]